MAERVGFEPTVEFPLHSLSRRALSTAQTPLRGGLGNRSRRFAHSAINSQNVSCAELDAQVRVWLRGFPAHDQGDV